MQKKSLTIIEQPSFDVLVQGELDIVIPALDAIGHLDRVLDTQLNDLPYEWQYVIARSFEAALTVQNLTLREYLKRMSMPEQIEVVHMLIGPELL